LCFKPDATEEKCRVVVLVRAWTAKSAAIKVRVFILFVTLFVRCRSHVLLLCLRWRERPNYRPQFRRARIRHWGYTGNPPALDKGSERIGGSRIPEGALTRRAERPCHGRSGELVNP